MCLDRLEDYRNRLRADENNSEETAMSIHQEEANERLRLTQQCIRPTQEDVNNYCDIQLNFARNVFELDRHGAMSEFSQSSADLCAQRFCAKPEVMADFFGLNSDGEYIYSGEWLYNQYSGLELNHEEYNSYINGVSGEKGGSCLDYFAAMMLIANFVI